jgi:hypothetical protein
MNVSYEDFETLNLAYETARRSRDHYKQELDSALLKLDTALEELRLLKIGHSVELERTKGQLSASRAEVERLQLTNGHSAGRGFECGHTIVVKLLADLPTICPVCFASQFHGQAVSWRLLPNVD